VLDFSEGIAGDDFPIGFNGVFSGFASFLPGKAYAFFPGIARLRSWLSSPGGRFIKIFLEKPESF